MKLEHKEIAQGPKGKSILKAWRNGAIQKLLDQGHTLHEAQKLAEANGDLISVDEQSNLVVTSGYNLLAKLSIAGFASGETDGIAYLEIGTGDTAPAISDTDTETGVARKQFTTASVSGAEVTCSVFYVSDDCTYSIKEVTVWGGSTATITLGTGTLYSHYLQTKDNSAGTYDLTFDYIVTYQAA